MTDSPRQEADVDSVASHWHRVPIYIPDSLIPAANLPPALGPLPCNLCECCHELRPTKNKDGRACSPVIIHIHNHGLRFRWLTTRRVGSNNARPMSTIKLRRRERVLASQKKLLGLIVERQVLPRQSPGDRTGLDRRPQFLPDVTHPPQMAH
jgi:hypothetical protein